MMQKALCLTLLVTLLLSACASPHVAEVRRHGDKNMSCEDLHQAVAEAEHMKQAAREDDRFKLGYIALLPAVVSVYRFHKAEKAAQERIDYLTSIYNAKNCAGGGYAAPQYNQQYYEQQYRKAPGYNYQPNSPYRQYR